ncbi:MAG: DNA-directed RNA polymerase subunit K [Candidatus Aenigmarchaeota archaeon]|nr:DNA-directed RNA polymerase subunit K [Candidatus Aenigmarchaeota archaeon]
MDREYTRYEKARIVSTRALQIAQGAPVLVDLPKGMTDPQKIAEMEWEKGVIPIDIKENKEKKC